MPLVYDCLRARTTPTLDGTLTDAAWAIAPWTSDFVDIEGDARPAPRFRTRAKMLWDERYFYFAAELEEPHVWGTLTEKNSIIYNDNDFEIFIDPDGDTLNYYEFEINALGTVMELTLDKPYKDGGNYRFIDTPGLRSKVHVKGTLNDARDIDIGWTVEVAIPWTGLQPYHAGPAVPRAGDEWRVNFSRVQWMHNIVDGRYVKVPKSERNEDNWVWSPQGLIDMHWPERWGRVRFVK